MKKILVFLLLMVPFTASAVPGTVVDVRPIQNSRVVYETVTEYRYECGVVNRSRGGIESTTNRAFGSTQGAIGAFVGGAIGRQVGGGSGKDAATVLGTIIGNQIGNDVAQNRQEQCRQIPFTNRVPKTEFYVSHYEVTVDINGSMYKVNRNYSPAVGSVIKLSLH